MRHSGSMLFGALVLLVTMIAGPAVGAAVVTAPVSSAAVAPGGATTRISVTSAGAQANGWSAGAAISADGRYVVFGSYASNLVAGDTNGQPDFFVRDRVTGSTARVSVSSDEAQGNSSSHGTADISADGRYVSFPSEATNLVAGDTNGQPDIFVRDLVAGTTTCVSVSTDEVASNGMTMDDCSISSDGQRVVFRSNASNLAPGDTNGQSDIFMRDLAAGTTTRVSVSSDEAQANNYSVNPTISGNGNVVVFASWASNLVAGDTTEGFEVFARDLDLGITVRISEGPVGLEANGASMSQSVSDNGRYVAYYSLASNLVPGDTTGTWDFFVHDWMEGTTTRIAEAAPILDGEGGRSLAGSISPDGSCVVFDSYAAALVTGDSNVATDAFVYDLAKKTTTRVSVNSAGTEGNTGSRMPRMSADGQYVVFGSDATNLVAGDTNAAGDIFVYGPADDSPPSPVAPMPVYRFYNSTNGTHFFTPSLGERDMVMAKWPSIFQYEGIAYYADPDNNTQPLYRFYNRRSQSHFYTADPGEAQTILAKWPDIFTLDGQTYAVNPGPVTDSIPVYRFYNLANGSHFYTSTLAERDQVIATLSSIYQYEGVAFWLGQ